MQTYDDINTIANVATLRQSKVITVNPYTPLLQDVNLVGAEMALATQDHLANKLDLAQGIAHIKVRHHGRELIPELAAGAIVSHNI